MHPAVGGAFGNDTDAATSLWGLDVGDVCAFRFDDEDGDVDIEQGGEIHGDGVDEIFEILRFEKAQDGVVDAGLIIHVCAGGLDDVFADFDGFVFFIAKAFDGVGLEVGGLTAFWALFGGDEGFDQVSVVLMVLEEFDYGGFL